MILSIFLNSSSLVILAINSNRIFFLCLDYSEWVLLFGTKDIDQYTIPQVFFFIPCLFLQVMVFRTHIHDEKRRNHHLSSLIKLTKLC